MGRRNRKQVAQDEDREMENVVLIEDAAQEIVDELETPAPEAETPEAVTPAPAKVRTHNSKGVRLAIGMPCLCGCELPTHTKAARFLSGHDAKLRKRVLALGEPLPEIVRPFFEDGETIGGMKLVDGEIVDVKRPGGWA